MRTRQVSPWLLFGLVVLSLFFLAEARAEELERGGEAIAPVTIGHLTYRCDRARMIATDAESGIVRDRWYVPGPCIALRAEGGEVVVTVGERGWTFEWRRSAPNARSAAMLPSSPVSLYALRKEGRLADDLYDDETALPNRAPIASAERERYEAMLAEITARAALDPTNPWWIIDEGVVLDALGRAAEARAAFEKAIAIDERYAIDLMLTAPTLDAFDPELGTRAFERGLSALKRSGYIPEYAPSLVSMMRFLPRPGLDLDVDRDYEVLARHAWRVQHLAPHVEGANRFFGAMAAAARRKGLGNEAFRFGWAQHQAGHDALFSLITPEARMAGHLLNITIGFAWAIFLLLIVKTARGARATSRTKVSFFERFHPFLRFTAGERIGFVGASAIAITAAWACAWGVAEIGAIAAAPIELGSGTPEHPGALKAAEGFADVDLETWGRWSREDWASAWRAKVGRSNDTLHNPFQAAVSIFRMSDTISTEGGVSIGMLMPSLLVMLFFAIAVLPPYRSPFLLPPRSNLAKAIGWLVPGASRVYGPFGFVLAGLLGTWILGSWMLAESDGQAATILDAIAAPNMARYFGARSFGPVSDSPITAAYRYGAVLVALHFLWMGIAEWRTRRAQNE